mmetsp:Transcript_2470/g.7432  ORF Transcript_2470/g.7432 Transcript_2470/m.7432 type:complete len:288 (+) Transcript_2470:1819-2682(+)
MASALTQAGTARGWPWSTAALRTSSRTCAVVASWALHGTRRGGARASTSRPTTWWRVQRSFGGRGLRALSLSRGARRGGYSSAPLPTRGLTSSVRCSRRCHLWTPQAPCRMATSHSRSTSGRSLGTPTRWAATRACSPSRPCRPCPPPPTMVLRATSRAPCSCRRSTTRGPASGRPTSMPTRFARSSARRTRRCSCSPIWRGGTSAPPTPRNERSSGRSRSASWWMRCGSTMLKVGDAHIFVLRAWAVCKMTCVLETLRSAQSPARRVCAVHSTSGLDRLFCCVCSC